MCSSIYEAYNDAENYGLYGKFSFVEDEEVAGIAIKHDLSHFHRFNWTKSTSWFKDIVKSYNDAKVRYTTSGEYDPNFFAYTRGKPQVYYYRLHVMAKLNSHLAFGVVLDGAIFSESSESTTRKPGGGIANRGNVTLRQKEDVMSRIAATMTASVISSKDCQAKRNEKMQLEQDTGASYMNLVALPSSAV